MRLLVLRDLYGLAGMAYFGSSSAGAPLGPSEPLPAWAQLDVVAALVDAVAERPVSAHSLCAQEQADALALQPERVWPPCEATRISRQVARDVSHYATLAWHPHVRAWPPVLQLRDFPQPCFRWIAPLRRCFPWFYSPPRGSQQPCFLRFCSQPPCSRRLCSQWPSS